MHLDEEQQDAVTEVINIGVGRAAASLSEMLGHRINLCVPAIKVCRAEGLAQKLRDESGVDVCVTQDFDGGLTGRAMLAFPQQSGVELSKILGEVDDPLDELSVDLVGILEEVGNIVLNGVLGTIGNMTDSALDYSVPLLAQGSEVLRMLTTNTSPEHQAEIDEIDQTVILADTRFDVVDSCITGSLILLFDIHSLRSILQTLLEPSER